MTAFPTDSFFGEEGGGSFDNNVWVVDPIDGTANFVRGIPQFCISLAYVCDGAIAVGIIYDPLTDELFAAKHGGGATLNGEPIRVSGMADLSQSSIEMGWSTRKPLKRYIDAIENSMEAGAVVRRGGSGSFGARPCGLRTDGRLLRIAHEFVGCACRVAARSGSGRLDERFSGRLWSQEWKSYACVLSVLVRPAVAIDRQRR